MPFTDKPQVFNAAINALSFGEAGREITLGGSNVYPLYAFDAPLANAPRVGVEVSDLGYEKAIPGLAAFYAGAETIPEQAARAAAMPGAEFVCLKLDSADPNGENASSEDCVATVKAVYEAIDKPLVVMGCKNVEKDTELLVKVAEALQGKNVLLMSAREEDYKTLGASAVLAYGQKLCGESAVDINLAKQLNVLMSQLGVPAASTVMNLGSAAAGYGFEYVASTMDRVKAAALEQNDTMLQMPVITPVALETWSVKESIMSQAEMPEWGDKEERAVDMEVVTASACLTSGSDAVILRHPTSVKTIAAMLAALA